jgi:hypothetical protein
MTAKERKSIANTLYGIQNAIDDLLDVIVGKTDARNDLLASISADCSAASAKTKPKKKAKGSK